jgi:hypothetical protein
MGGLFPMKTTSRLFRAVLSVGFFVSSAIVLATDFSEFSVACFGVDSSVFSTAGFGVFSSVIFFHSFFVDLR